uniref:kinesin-like protein KIN-7K, chloroplastic n=1 Tax=Erigeron canadensis TaxID=72917 RepID=UPI001CB8A3A6|nr:kinesin-like protein KIN-7K, chloroplastic [Erigeron canadensis]
MNIKNNSKMAAKQGVPKPKKSNVKHSNSKQNNIKKIVSKASAAVDKPPEKENVTVTVRFRPLSAREIRQEEEIAWYADGETIVRNEHTSIAYAYDQVFGPTTTTRLVYDIAAQHVVSGAMEGINGTILAYGVTSSGKTHTMHGDQRSPGIIPLAVKDAFSIIQETPQREFLLRLSYLEIYNEVVNDLLNPAGQHLRIREDSQGIFVEGIKEEVVLSAGHALSIIAAGEEQRHVGSTNFNLHSSRSHTIFTLTIESSPCGENYEGEAVNLSQLNLIDLAGSESSKAETTGIRRKEGAYINKSLLTLGTVMSKLTDGKAAHIPYRDSKLTRLLQSSLSGHGRVSLICTVTPSSSNSEETHNTLKFAHRAKHIEIQAAQNKIIDEKSLIKTYQNEIRCLKEELEQLQSGTMIVSQLNHAEGNDDILLEEELKDGLVKTYSRLEQEEAKDALLSQIQNLRKLILVSTNSSHPFTLLDHSASESKYAFEEDELAYLPQRRQDLSLDDENLQLHVTLDKCMETKDALKEDKKIKKPGLLNWLKPRKRDSTSRDLTASDKSSRAKSTSTPSSPADYRVLPIESRHSYSSLSECTSVGFLSEARQDRETNKDAFLLQEAHPVEMIELNDQIKQTNKQISLLEDQATNSVTSSHHKMDDDHDPDDEQSRSVTMLEAQLNEKAYELEAQDTDNQVIQEHLNRKNIEYEGLQETIAALKQLLSNAHELRIGELNTETGLTTISDTSDTLFQQSQALKIQQLQQEVIKLTESKYQLESENKILEEESSYAKELAADAAIELKALSEEVMKLLIDNERLSADLLAAQNNSPTVRETRSPTTKKKEQSPSQSDLMRELASSKEREMAYEAILSEKYKKESELQQTVKESKQRESYLEKEIENMWILIKGLKKLQGAETIISDQVDSPPFSGLK